MKAMAKIIGAAFATVLFAGALFVVCAPRAEPGPPESLAALAPELGVRFPPSTKLVGVLRENGLDDWIAAKLTMSRNDLPIFLASTPLDESRLSPGEQGHFGPDRTFWDPSSHPDLRSGQAFLTDVARAFNVGVADLDAVTVAVYIVNHGT